MEAARADIATLRHQYAGNEVSPPTGSASSGGMIGSRRSHLRLASQF